MDLRREFTTFFIPSFLEIILRGLKALSALKDLMKEISRVEIFTKTQSNAVKTTIVKSRMFQLSLR